MTTRGGVARATPRLGTGDGDETGVPDIRVSGAGAGTAGATEGVREGERPPWFLVQGPPMVARQYPRAQPLNRAFGPARGLPGPVWSVRRKDVLLGRELVLAHDADRAGHPVRAVVAVAAGVLVEVLLVVGLCVVERPGLRRRPQLGGDVAVAVLAQDALEGLAGAARRGLLVRGGPVDRRAVLRADVVALAVALRRVVVLPERRHQQLGADRGRVERHQDRLGVPGPARAHLFVCRVRGEAAHVARRRGHHAGELPEDALGAPEAAHRHVEHLRALGPGALQGGAEDLVGLGDAVAVR